jgi:hypothetical protein
MRQIIPEQNLVHLADDESYTVSCADLVARKITYVGEDNDGLWIEKTPFDGRVRVFDPTIVNLLFFRAAAQRDTPETPETLSEAMTRRKAEIDELRNAKIAGGVPYEFPNGPGTVQMRNQTDITNILGVVVAGQALIGSGDTTTTLNFRDTEDVTHALTGPQVVAMGLTASSFISGLYGAAWAHKDALSALFTLSDVVAYDITLNWPE